MIKYLGKCDYNGSGRKNCKAFVKWNLKPTDNGLVFTMQGEIWNPRETYIYCGGQVCHRLLEYFPDNQTLRRMIEIWREYHLNDVNAGTPRQTTAIEEWIAKGNKYDYEDACKYLKSINLYEDTKIDDLKPQECLPDEVRAGKRGYRYGEGWLFREIPANVVEEIKSWGIEK